MTADPQAPPRTPPGPWLPLLRVGGIRLYLDPLLPLVMGVVVFTGILGPGPLEAALLLAGLLVFVLIHEGAHALAARRRGLAVQGIFLHLLPVTYVERGAPQDAWRVALAGPAVNLLLGGLLAGLRALLGAGWPTEAEAVASDPLALAALANLGMGLVNLLPLLPADGGRALRALLELRVPARAARTTMAVLGLVAALVLAALSVLLFPWPVSVYGLLAATLLALAGWRER